MEEIGQKILSACSPRPMLMGAQRNALRAFNAGVSLSCLCILAHRLSHLFRSLVLSLTQEKK